MLGSKLYKLKRPSKSEPGGRQTEKLRAAAKAIEGGSRILPCGPRVACEAADSKKKYI